MQQAINLTDIYCASTLTRRSQPFYDNPVAAGFPSPADDFVHKHLDLNTFIVKNPPATFFVKVSGFSMVDANILPEDILVVDRSRQAKNGDIIIANIMNEFTVKRLDIRPCGIYLKPENKRLSPIKICEGSGFEVWGVVTYVIHKA